MREQVVGTVAAPLTQLVLDTGLVEFCDSSGLRALILSWKAAHEARPRHVDMTSTAGRRRELGDGLAGDYWWALTVRRGLSSTTGAAISALRRLEITGPMSL